MKLIFYKQLLKKEKITEATDMMVYSFYVSKSIMAMDCVFGRDEDYTALDKDYVNGLLDECENLIDLKYFRDETVAYELGLKVATLKSSKKRLEQLGYLGHKDEYDGDLIYIEPMLLWDGHFDLYISELSSANTIVYSYIKTLASNYGGKIDTWKSKLTTDLYMTENNFESVLKRLKKANKVKRVGRFLHIL